MRIEMRPLGLAAQPERPGKIDHARAFAHQRRPHLGRERIGDRKEHRIGFLGQPLGIEALNRAVPDPLQRRDPPGFGGARTHRQADVHMGVLSQPPQQLDAGVARCSGDTDPDPRITIHPNH